MSEFADAKTVEKVVPQTSAVKSFLSGGFGGIASVLVGHPFDLAKVTILILNSFQHHVATYLMQAIKGQAGPDTKAITTTTSSTLSYGSDKQTHTRTRLKADLKERATWNWNQYLHL